MPQDDSFISASELAQMGYCERKLVFDARHGARDTAEQARAKERGRALHARFYEERERIAEASATRGRGFIATLALGDCGQTRQLRAFRDLVLRRSSAGRRRSWWSATGGCARAACASRSPRPRRRCAATAGIGSAAGGRMGIGAEEVCGEISRPRNLASHAVPHSALPRRRASRRPQAAASGSG